MSKNPQKAHPCVEKRRMTYRSSKSVHWCDLCAWQRPKRQRNLTCQTGYSPRPPTLSDRNQILHAR